MIIYPFIFVPMRTRVRSLINTRIMGVHYSLNKDNCGVIR